MPRVVKNGVIMIAEEQKIGSYVSRREARAAKHKQKTIQPVFVSLYLGSLMTTMPNLRRAVGTAKLSNATASFNNAAANVSNVAVMEEHGAQCTVVFA